MKKYKLINNIAGWGVFAIAAIVYLLTIEPTASFWDCGEFITSAYKLEVGHPPGAPFFMLVGNLFTQFASDPSQVAKMVNSMSALLSAFTILFLFWTLTHLTRKLVAGKEQDTMTLGQIITIIGSGVVGALAYTFSDTFWFSAVEGEVYAFSSMLTALVFWLILKWEANADKPGSDKWIVLIAYIMGLSVGVHLLNLLCIPAIVLVYYFKRNETPTWKGGLLYLLLSFALIVVVMYGVIPGFTKVGGWFELFFVNSLGMSYNSGFFIYLVLLLASLSWCLFETVSAKGKESRAKVAFFISLALAGILFISGSVLLWVVLVALAAYFIFKDKRLHNRFIHLAASSLTVMLIGFSAYALIPIRSAANPPLDLNSPEDVFSLGSYLNREQYGQTPLFYGHTYASQVQRNADGTPVYTSQKKYGKIVKKSPEEKDRYVASEVPTYKYTNSMLFPRMHTHQGEPGYRNHIIGYERWGDVADPNKPPTLWQNIRFFFGYQLNYMYFRYFLWNFSGRQNDIQGDGGLMYGNWITGIPPIDNHVLGLGPQDDIAPDIADNRAHNKFYMLPLILGLIGILYQFKLKEKGKQSFIIVFLLFFMTGIAIVLYLNQTPFEPRERDYAYAGSFYAFAIWIGLGVAGIDYFLRKYIKNRTASAVVASVIGVLIPLQMVGQTWDDHDRSGRTLARDTGMNYLSSVGPDGIIFTNGDNDTYPLWYVQETEGFRTDVRVTNLSFLQTEWYIDQLVRQAYESKPLPISWTRPQYWDEAASYAHIITKQEIEKALQDNNIPAYSFPTYYDINAFKDTISLRQTMESLRTGQNAQPANPFTTGDTRIIPGNQLYLDVDTARVDWAAMHARPASRMYVNLGGKSSVYRHEMMILEMLSNINDGNWTRPLYYATTVEQSLYLNMKDRNFSLNGLTYQVVPGTPLSNRVNIHAAYENMMTKFRWGGLEENPDIYLDETSRRMISTFRLSFSELINALIDEGENEKALAALDKCTTVMPGSAVPYRNDGLLFARAYYSLGETEKAQALISQISERVNRNLDWFGRLKPQQVNNNLSDVIYNNINPLLLIATIYQEYDREKYQVMVDDLLQRAQVYYTQGVSYVGDTILRELTNSSIRGYYLTDTASVDTAQQSVEAQTMEKALKMMQQFSPRLLEQYNKQAAQ
ncbi:DUF2723 domain-containing protein [Limibacterium fermenti]|uniref:DUF2723 domain-containing protein n=1 Tax=Limibacterium fermenti TaxID=3229863 RepID=UPI003A73381E